MHKTLYIDIDEEITSIIDRVRKAAAMEIIIVAPKNAMLLQSIVNLKLLKKEADRRKKQLLIITQDKIGKKLIEKAGILAQAKAGKDIFLDAEPEEKPYEPLYAEEASEIKEELQKAQQEKEFGSSDYFDEPLPPEPEVPSEKPAESTKVKSIKEKNISPAATKKSLKTDGRKETKSRVNMSDIVTSQSQPKEKPPKMEPAKINPEPEIFIDEKNSFAQSYTQANSEPSKISQVSMKKADKFFRGARRMKKDLEVERVGGGAKKYFIIFAGLFVLFAALASAYFLLTKATLALHVKNQEKAVSLDLTADATASAPNSAGNVLPANLEQVTKDLTEDFDSTGSKEGGSKAAGQVVIYNEFSSADQPLVATTRLETSDGKIFRITKNVVVPGSATVGGETKPGAIEADVIADQPGDGYNIGPTDFRITGFKDTPAKFDKFYAKSAKPMTGGSSGAAKLVTAPDIASAKETIAADGKKAAIADLKGALPAGRKIFDDAVQVEVISTTSADNAGAEKEKFSVTAKVKATAISFQEADVKKMLQDSLKQSGALSSEISFDQPINYILADSNILQKTLKFQAKTDAKTAAGVDLENFKKGILGKTAEDAQTYAKNFPAIQQMDVSFWPFFVNRIPTNEGRVVVEVK